jgi:osmotically-inducible protein OsmY
MAWKKLVATMALGAGFGFGVAGPAWAEEPVTTSTETQQQIQDNLSRVRSVSDQIEVKVDPNGVVKLLGDVESSGEEKAAVDAAKSIPGVTQVKDDLRVMPIQTP